MSEINDCVAGERTSVVNECGVVWCGTVVWCGVADLPACLSASSLTR